MNLLVRVFTKSFKKTTHSECKETLRELRCQLIKWIKSKLKESGYLKRIAH